jgi:hypothetical protein
MQAASLSLSMNGESSSKEFPSVLPILSQFPLLSPNAFAVPDNTTTSFEFNPARLYGKKQYVTKYSGATKAAFKAQFVFLIGQLEKWITQQNYTPVELQGLNIPLAMKHLHTELFQPGYADMQSDGYFEKIKTDLEWIFQWLQQEAIPLSRRRDNLVTHLPPHNVCSPGLPTHFAEWKDELQQEISIQHWLLKYRKAIVKEYAAQHSGKYKIPIGNMPHVQNVYMTYAETEHFIPKELEIMEVYASHANISEQDFKDFHQRFLERYIPCNILDYLVSQFSDEVEKITKMSKTRKADVWFDLKGPAMRKLDAVIGKLGFKARAADFFISNEEEGEFENWSRLNTTAIRMAFLNHCLVQNIFNLPQKPLTRNINLIIESSSNPEANLALSFFEIEGKCQLVSDCLMDESLSQTLFPVVRSFIEGSFALDEDFISFNSPSKQVPVVWLYPFMSPTLATAIFDYYFNPKIVSDIAEEDLIEVCNGRVKLLNLNKQEFFSLTPKLRCRHIIEILRALTLQQLQLFFQDINDIKKVLKYSKEENIQCFEAIDLEHIVKLSIDQSFIKFTEEYLSEDQQNNYINKILEHISTMASPSSELVSKLKIFPPSYRINVICNLKRFETFIQNHETLSNLLKIFSIPEILAFIESYPDQIFFLIKGKNELSFILQNLSEKQQTACVKSLGARLLLDCFLSDESLSHRLFPIVCSSIEDSFELKEDFVSLSQQPPVAWLYPFMSADLATAIFDHYFNPQIPPNLIDSNRDIRNARKKLLTLNKQDFFSLIPKLQHRHIIEILRALTPQQLQQFLQDINDIKKVLKYSRDENIQCFEAIGLEHIAKLSINHSLINFPLEYLSEDEKIDDYIDKVLQDYNTSTGLISILKIWPRVSRMMLIAKLNISETIRNYQELSDTLKLFSIPEINFFMESHWDKIFPLISGENQLSFIFKNLSKQQQTAFVQWMGGHIVKITQDPHQLIFLWSIVTDEQKTPLQQKLVLSDEQKDIFIGAILSSNTRIKISDAVSIMSNLTDIKINFYIAKILDQISIMDLQGLVPISKNPKSTLEDRTRIPEDYKHLTMREIDPLIKENPKLFIRTLYFLEAFTEDIFTIELFLLTH